MKVSSKSTELSFVLNQIFGNLIIIINLIIIKTIIIKTIIKRSST